MDCSTPGFPFLHYLPEFAQIHVHWANDVIQTISPSTIPFSSCLQSFSASGYFPINQYFASGGQRIGASVSVFPMNIQGWFPLGLTGLILLSKGISRVFSNTTVQCICRVHCAKCQTGCITSWNQDCREKYQQPQICRWYQSNGRKWRGTKEPLDEDERGEWKSWLKTKH